MTDTTVNAEPLWQALLAAQQSVVTVGRDGKNSAQNYSFTTAEAVMTEARARLHPAGLVLTFSEAGLSTRDTERVDKSTGQVVPGAAVATVTLEGVLVHAASGVQYRFRVSSEGADYGDKAVPKAYTNAVKYGCRHLLLIPFGDDPEADSPDRGRSRQPRAAANGAASEKQVGMLYAKSKAAGLNDAGMLKVASWAVGSDLKSLDDVPRAKVDDVVAAIEKAKAKADAQQSQQPTVTDADVVTADDSVPF